MKARGLSKTPIPPLLEVKGGAVEGRGWRRKKRKRFYLIGFY